MADEQHNRLLKEQVIAKLMQQSKPIKPMQLDKMYCCLISAHEQPGQRLKEQTMVKLMQQDSGVCCLIGAHAQSSLRLKELTTVKLMTAWPVAQGAGCRLVAQGACCSKACSSCSYGQELTEQARVVKADA